MSVVNNKPRVFIISDISNEPDDAESFVRYLLYSNEFETRGLAACTSTWMKRAVHPEDMQKIIVAYSQVVDNLNHHVHPRNKYQPAAHFLEMLKTGPALYGKEALAPGVPLSDAAELLLQRLDESDDPLWVLCWGGTNVLAQALQHAQHHRSPAGNETLCSKLRVYAISDQDDTGSWIRQQFPDVFYIVSLHGWNQYGLAAWTGISGDKYYKFDQGGPDFEKVSEEWIRENIQIGPFGKAYPKPMCIPEGDTPTFLYLIQNGLGCPEHPEWGSWGGRYIANNATGTSRHYCDTVDRVIGLDGKQHISNQATIWRWRSAYQNDFAARMQWTLTPDIRKCNHAPVAIVNGSAPGPEAIRLEAEAGTEMVFDASDSYDPDGDMLTFSWLHYKEVTSTTCSVDQEVADIPFEDLSTDKSQSVVKIRLPPPEKCAIDMFSGKALKNGQMFHFVVQLEDNGKPSLTSYKRIVVQVTNKALAGGRDRAVESIAEVHALQTVT